MNSLLINWKTSLAGLLAIIGVVVKLLADLRTKNLGAIFTNLQELFPLVVTLLVGLGLMNAKDNNTVGAGNNAKKVD